MTAQVLKLGLRFTFVDNDKRGLWSEVIWNLSRCEPKYGAVSMESMNVGCRLESDLLKPPSIFTVSPKRKYTLLSSRVLKTEGG